jgi:hypothetical protein
MFESLNRYDIAKRLVADENGGWSYDGALALADWCIDFEEQTGEETELDIVALRCDFSEWASLIAWAEDYIGRENGGALAVGSAIESDDDFEDAIREYITDRGTLIEFDSGIIVSSF